MSITGLTHESIQATLGKEIPEILLVIAKHSVLGVESDALKDILGVAAEELDALTDSQDYKDVRLLVGAEYARDSIEADFSWDSIESDALKGLSKRAKRETDPDMLLRIAATANKAQRRNLKNAPSHLDPTSAAARIPLQLTRRYTEKLNGAGQITERSETRQISVINGSAVNPTFKDVESLLDIDARGTPTPNEEMQRLAMDAGPTEADILNLGRE